MRKRTGSPGRHLPGFWAGIWVDVTGRFGKQQAVDVPLAAPAKPTHLLDASLSSEDPSVRSAAALELAGATELRAEALAALESHLNDPDLATRYGAAWAAGHLHSVTGDKDESKLDQMPPKPIKSPRPEYPNAAFIAGIEGTVLVEILIGEQGEVARLDVRESIPELDAAALACVRRWRFEPARANGVPRACVARIPLTFRKY
jgi:TonB family protein